MSSRNVLSNKELANAIRALSMDGVQQANSSTQAHLWVWLISLKFFGVLT
ncbi:hypothetical protein PWW31_18210 [Vibrio harveyi]|nr:hypothetical protein PWW31_18210 [Vibrio harveyi]